MVTSWTLLYDTPPVTMTMRTNIVPLVAPHHRGGSDRSIDDGPASIAPDDNNSPLLATISPGRGHTTTCCPAGQRGDHDQQLSPGTNDV